MQEETYLTIFTFHKINKFEGACMLAKIVAPLCNVCSPDVSGL